MDSYHVCQWRGQAQHSLMHPLLTERYSLLQWGMAAGAASLNLKEQQP